MAIVPGREYGDIRKQASEDVHGLTPSTIEQLGDRMEKFLPGMSSTAGKSNKNFFEGLLPEGAELDPRKFNKQANMPMGGGFSNGMSGGGRGLMTSPQRPYQPEFESPDRQMYPVHRILANRYWRLFYKLDPVIGTCIDLYATMPWSDFQLTGEGVTGEIKEAYESMCQEVNLLRILEYIEREFLVLGEAIPHCFFDKSRGIWTYIALHNPDQLEVIDAPFIKMDPVVEFIPDDRLRAVLTSSNQLLRKIREQMPPELISRLIARQNIPLSPINMTFLPRRLHPYDTRGTSIISRMWRILMYEDAIYNASIQTARRHASPIKVAKLGNPQTGWIPSPEHERRLLELLAQAEVDVNAWLVYHYGIQFDLVGTTDRVMNIAQHNEVIERVKLNALGVSKSFLFGEVTYASSLTGLSVFLQRMKAVRNYIMNSWILPKFFKPIAMINGWVRRDKGEITHRYRIKRSAADIDRENRWIIPDIIWEKSLDHTVNTELVNAMNTLEGSLGIKFSKSTKFATVGKSFEEETRKLAEEQEFEKKYKKYLPAEVLKQDAAGGPGGGPGGGAGMPPPMPAGGEGEGDMPPPEGGEAPIPGPEADKSAGGGGGPSGKKDPAVRDLKSNLWDHKGNYGNWKASEIVDLIQLIKEGETQSPFWSDMNDGDFKRAVASGDSWAVLEVIDDYLGQHGYPRADFDQLRQILNKEGVLREIELNETAISRVEDALPEDSGSLSDKNFDSRVMTSMKDKPDVVRMDNPNNLVVGYGNDDVSRPWSGDISDLVE